MSDQQTTTFETMGGDWITQLVNVSGDPSKYTRPVPRKNTQSGGVPGEGAGRAAKGQGTVIRNANGPACTIVAKISYPNAEGSDMTGRNLRRVRPGGTGGFYGGRAAAGNAGGV
jgi:hypothetical protein